MNHADNLEFRQLDKASLQTLVSWAAAEGWNPGPNDADVFWATDPEGFYGCFDGDDLIGGGSIVAYGSKFGFMGFFIVKPEYRGHGIGRSLWYKRRDTLLGRLDEGAAIGMDGVVAMQPFYAKGGFEVAFRDERYERMGEAMTYSDKVSPVTEADTDAILAYDVPCFGLPRPQFMKPWLQMPENKMFCYKEDGVLKGFAIVRKVQQGYKVCPLFADNAAVAEELYRACLDAVAGEQLYIDIPVTNTEAVNLVKKYNATYVFECARMYYGKPPVMDINKVFGITSFELG